jgi:hypothetical protein
MAVLVLPVRVTVNCPGTWPNSYAVAVVAAMLAVGSVSGAIVTVSELGDPTVYWPPPSQQHPLESVSVTLREPLKISPSGATAMTAEVDPALTTTEPPSV